ncbi:MAG: FadR family transcriptional regulator [Microbacteriaceae bacterium]|jgi:GntR family transcriptional repressor for pyruvate dehydrogenase complex|nr:FadR family transcriptional regulator [Microbacteriaceae bacterium]
MDWSHVNRATVLSLPDRLSIEIEKLIMSDSSAAGSKLPPERELAETLGVSRVSIRQALHELQVRGLIDRRPGRGTVVLTATGAARERGASIAAALASEARDITDVMELRAIIEPPIAALTAARATPRDIAQLTDLVHRMSMELPDADYADLDRAFHQALAQYAHNSLLSMLNEQIAILVAPSRDPHLQTTERRRVSIDEHHRILAAIAAHDSDAAEAAAAAHVESITAEVLRITAQSSHNSAEPPNREAPS